MAPTRNSPKATSKTNSSPYTQDARRVRGKRSSMKGSSNNSTSRRNISDDEDASPSYNDIPSTGGRECTTHEQRLALEGLFWSTWGYPSHQQKVDIAARLGKSITSITNWFQNERHPREKIGEKRKKAWFIVKPLAGDKARPAQGPHPQNRYACQTIVKSLVEVGGDPFSWERCKPKASKSPVTPTAKTEENPLETLFSSLKRPRSDSAASQALSTPDGSSGDSDASAVSSPRSIIHTEHISIPTSIMATVRSIAEEQAAYALLDMMHAPCSGSTNATYNTDYASHANSSKDLHIAHIGMSVPLPQGGDLAFTPYVTPTKAWINQSNIRTVVGEDEEMTDVENAAPYTDNQYLAISGHRSREGTLSIGDRYPSICARRYMGVLVTPPTHMRVQSLRGY